MKNASILAVVVCVTAVANFASADTIQGIDIEFVIIGNAGNAADTGGNVGSGSVGYQFQIGKYEVTNSQWNAFTAIAGAPSGNPATGYDQSSQYTGDQQPSSNVSWYEAAQFCNYLTSGDKSQGAYQFSGTNTDPGDFLGVDRALAVSVYGKAYVLPTEDEWYKAAYFKPDGSGYSLYANGTNMAPSTSEAAYSQIPLLAPWDAGDGTMEQNGTFDMMGNVWEWNETFLYSPDDGILGGSSYNSVDTIKSTYRNYGTLYPYDEFYDAGFRVASISEHAPLSLLAPNGGEIYIVAAITEISWDSSGDIIQVFLEYSTNNGSDWTTIGIVDNTGIYEWQVPDTVSDQCLIRISDAAHSSVNDSSNAVFTIGKYEWYSYNGHQYSLTIEYAPWVNCEAEAVAFGGHLVTINNEAEREWLLDPSLPLGNSYAPGYPNHPAWNGVWCGLKYVSGDKSLSSSWEWISGEPITYWNPSHIGSPVPGTVGIHMTFSGTYNPDPGTFNNNPAHDTDPASYLRGVIEYVPKINILTPKPGDFVSSINPFTISWEMETKIPVPQVKIELSVDNGITWEPIDQVDNTGSYPWSIPDIISNQCILRISDPLDPAFKSTVPFEIGRSPRVYFADANLKTAVETALGVTNPTYEDMLKLTYLNAKSKGITSLVGLETALNLATLYLHQNTISDISPLTGLNKLTILNLYMNNITDISPLSGLTKLYSLAISLNKISDISPLAGLNNLIYLYINNNQINNFSALTGNTRFKEIYATRNAVLTKETYLNHIPTIRTNNPNLKVFQYDPGCQTLRSTDVNQDCQVNLLDLAMIASDWITCNHIYEEMCP